MRHCDLVRLDHRPPRRQSDKLNAEVVGSTVHAGEEVDRVVGSKPEGGDVVTTTTRDLDYVLSAGTQRVVHELLRAEHGPEAVVQRPISAGISTTHAAPADYPAGIAAARRVAARARRLVYDYAREARGAGTPWSELAGPLGIVADVGDPAEAAFREVAGEPPAPYDQRSVGWHCTSCGQRMIDHGPYNGHPADDESGHAASCSRHLAEIAAFRARNGDR